MEPATWTVRPWLFSRKLPSSVSAQRNAMAWIAHRADHHPDLSVHYGHCVVRWSTHDAGGITELDFHGAAQVDALLNA